MEIRGKIIAVLPVKDGIGKTTGNEWKSQEFVLGQKRANRRAYACS